MTEPTASAPPGLAVEHLSFGYGAELVLRDVTFSVEKRRFCALLGPNGAGKTSLFALLTRLAMPRAGRIGIDGLDLAGAPRAALSRMGIVFQQSTLDLDLSVRSNLSYYAALRGLYGRDAARRIDAALDRLGLRDRAGVKARELNGGHRRRTEIARALMHGPQLLLLDEPTVGLDPESRAEITRHVHALCETEGITVFWATHLVDEVAPGDDLVILHQGRVLARGVAAEVAGDRPLEAVFLDMTARSA
ncbi:ABC transporter ATP-binding protein [Salipiger mangrovisoli]|uniref:ATP-binding cassette domain-containing protein n=1 Tax=Salipiger mangrovisoli TaxID=2865933 RepID=A0ABR9X088_9RHOB|nr:ABC transporter ATP-binding protein [Salipiger mangrovisoli]MBE9636951.1 ATP-binding cassette domain-containing protein [Salipiger mangrovisoli]